ncbi:testis-specific protein TEX28 [Nycticebus coucang]|uniref:testis-specific protein TEX28 n=1 Tax=Nycticebus coucang TaxID=9470 RepID=UPI00234C58B9|nr:testis-specific protein TEX28 [Nycticebus coucang]
MVLKAEYTKGPSATLPSNVPSCRSLSSEDGPSGHSSLSGGELARNLQESVKHRILYLSEQLRVERASRDENTVGYLKLVSKADRHQAVHIRQAFEKVNQRASATIAQIERRLRQCHQQLQELEEGCRPKGSVQPAESSPDSHEQPGEKAQFTESPKQSEEDCLPTSLPDIIKHFTLQTRLPGVQQGRLSEKYLARQRNLLLQKVKEELKEVKQFHIGLWASYKSLKERYLTDLQVSLESLQEDKCRQTLLEEQMNDHLQGHLDEIYFLRQSLACTEEKMAYLSYERAKEVWEVMETFKSRMSKLETLQQVTQLEIMESLRSRPQDFLYRFVSLLLTLVTLLLISVSAVCAFPTPLLSSRLRTCTTLMLLGLGALVWQKFTSDWQEWVPSIWRLYSKDPRPPLDGP